MKLTKVLTRAAPFMRRQRRWIGAVVLLVVLVSAAFGWRLIRARRAASEAQIAAAASRTLAVMRPAPRPTRVIGFAEGCMTSQCHTSMSHIPAVGTVHEPVTRGACDACHGPDSGGHTYPLRRTGDALCGNCHQTGGQSAFQHKAMSDKGCLACHDAHTSPGASLLLAGSVEQTCVRCHPASEGSHRHRPYAMGQCEACHEPHGSDTALLLRGGDVEGHCRLCHGANVDAMAAAPHSHRNAEGSCLACHGAHATDWKGLQTLESRRGCIACHAEVGKAVAGAVVSHDAVLTGDECASCHEPHASANAMMLREDQAPVCLNCHSKPVVAADGRRIPEMATAITATPLIHGPVRSGDCGACHSVHGGKHARLLKELNPKVLVGGFDIRNYALCFACHDQRLALADAADVTRFRNGEVNLHRVHLQAGERSRSCASCHAVHSSDQPRLIAKTVAYDGSEWKMSMGFFLTPEGGGCAPGCHEPLRYSRSPLKDLGAVKERGAP